MSRPEKYSTVNSRQRDKETSYNRTRVVIKEALTKEEYDKLAEKLSYPPTWVPVRKRAFSMDVTTQEGYFNQTKPLPST